MSALALPGAAHDPVGQIRRRRVAVVEIPEAPAETVLEVTHH
jgi:hypothetical protein